MRRRTFLGFAGAALASPFVNIDLRPLPPEDKKFREGQLIYFPETGHHLSGAFLKFHQTHRKGYLIGAPITEPLRLRDGRLIQFFENTCLEKRGGEVLPLALGTPYAGAEGLSLNEPPIHREFYDKYGGPAFFGRTLTSVLNDDQGNSYQFTENFCLVHQDPLIDEPLLEKSYAQYLANRDQYPRLIWPGEYTVLPLGRYAAQNQNLDTRPAQMDENAVSVEDFKPKKQILVDISGQTLTAFEGVVPVLHTFISSGRYGYDTDLGLFSVTRKNLTWRYISPFPNDWYDTPDVPWNLLVIPSTGVFIHGVFWHDVFGQRRSHGCVNMNLDDARWMYHWADLGTPVDIIP